MSITVQFNFETESIDLIQNSLFKFFVSERNIKIYNSIATLLRFLIIRLSDKDEI